MREHNPSDVTTDLDILAFGANEALNILECQIERGWYSEEDMYNIRTNLRVIAASLDHLNEVRKKNVTPATKDIVA
jgi:hypothetical protein